MLDQCDEPAPGGAVGRRVDGQPDPDKYLLERILHPLRPEQDCQRGQEPFGFLTDRGESAEKETDLLFLRRCRQQAVPFAQENGTDLFFPLR